MIPVPNTRPQAKSTNGTDMILNSGEPFFNWNRDGAVSMSEQERRLLRPQVGRRALLAAGRGYRERGAQLGRYKYNRG